MTNIMEQILTGKLNSSQNYLSDIKEFVNEEDIGILINILGGIKKHKLYNKTLIHGLYHSEKVLLFTYLLAKNAGITTTPDDFKILVDAALYHDFKRQNDNEDTLHGLSSATFIEEVIDDEIYKNKTNLNLLKAIVDIHSQKDLYCEKNFDNYCLDKSEYQRYEMLYKILKDADALDRARFADESRAALNPEFLRIDFSKELIRLSKKINAIYSDIINEKREKHEIDTSKGGGCFHSISFDFFKINSILKHGILSASEAEKQNLNIARNFEGGNSSDWISVVDEYLIKDGYTGFKDFTQQGIGFMCVVPEMIAPLPSIRKDEAIEKGLPFNKSGHEDEKYVYRKIPVENILCVMIPEKHINDDIRGLDYIYNSLSFSLFENRLKYYMGIFASEGIELFDNDEYTYDKYVRLLKEYKSGINDFNFSDKTAIEKTETQKRLNTILPSLNKYIQNAMYKYYSKMLNLSGQITVLDVVKYEMAKIGIEYNYVCGGAEAIFILNSINKEIDQKKRTV